MALPESFDDAYAAALEVTGGEEMLGVTLSVACAGTLPVAAAGISVFGTLNFRTPIGASDQVATSAERLQFTTGEGPCLAAHQDQRPVLATGAMLAARWPSYHRALTTTTPYRAVVALPLLDGLGGLGALDLYFNRLEEMFDLPLQDAATVAEAVAHLLAEQPLRPTLVGHREPAWLGAPAAKDRQLVMLAMGMLTVAADLTFSDALAVLRARAFGTDQSVDQVSADVVGYRLPIEDLRIADRGGH